MTLFKLQCRDDLSDDRIRSVPLIRPPPLPILLYCSPEELFNWLFDVVETGGVVPPHEKVDDDNDDPDDDAGGARITWHVQYQRANGNAAAASGYDPNEDDGWVEDTSSRGDLEDRYRMRAFVHLRKDDIQAVLPIAKVRH